MPEDLTFNSYAANELVIEYERETGVQLRFRRVGERFPDAVLEDCDGREVGVEFVSNTKCPAASDAVSWRTSAEPEPLKIEIVALRTGSAHRVEHMAINARHLLLLIR